MSRVRSYTRILFLFLVLFVMTSCADTPMTFRFDADTSAEDREDAIEQFEQWGNVVLPEYRPVESPNGFWLITFTDDIPPHNGLPGTAFDGRACADHAKHCPRDYQIIVRSRRSRAALGGNASRERTKEIVRHELGHSLGLDHVHDDETALMWGPTPDEMRAGRRRTKPMTKSFTASDMRECLSAGACPSITGFSLAELWRGRHRPTECD